MRLPTKQMLWVTAVLVGVVLVAPGAGYAQAPKPVLGTASPAPQKPEPAVVPLKVTVVITRHKNDKAQTVVSRMPFEVWVNAGSTATIRSSSEVPIPTTTLVTPEGADKPAPVTTFNYRTMGTSLTVEARALADGRYTVALTIDESQISPVPELSNAGPYGPKAAFQSFRSQATPVLRDGQTVQHSLATDRLSGDLTKVEVTLNVVK